MRNLKPSSNPLLFILHENFAFLIQNLICVSWGHDFVTNRKPGVCRMFQIPTSYA
eukprot:UN20591